MSDEHEEDRDSEPPRPKTTKKKKKKRRRRSATSAQAERPPRRRRTEAEASGEAQWTTNQLVLAAVAGLGIGAFGGYYAAQGDPAAVADKDSTQPTGQGTAQKTAGRSESRGARTPQDASARTYVELAKWSPRIGPEHAKVTIIEFTDFQ